MPTAEREKLRQITAQAHQQGRKVRFWGGPDIPVLWAEQLAAGVDLINTDKLAELRAFLTRK
jgi:glycerophosphoryl diester phosphodiesterase